MKKYRITLTEGERTALETKSAKGKAAARKLTQARIMWPADSGPCGPGWTDQQISEALQVEPKTVANLRQRIVEAGFETALNGHLTANHRLSKVDGEVEARLIAQLCGPAPEATRAGTCGWWRIAWSRWRSLAACRTRLCG